MAFYILAIVAVVLTILLYRDLFSTSNPFPSGRSYNWKLDQRRKTELISNRRLGLLQRHRDDGGLRETNDQIVVWAREFLDDNVLYNDVLSNVRRGISYFYILDRQHTGQFRKLLSKLYEDLPDRCIVDEAINVIFVRPELTLNNFVILSYGTERQVAYSSLIYDDRPFAWIRQSDSRARIIMDRVKVLVAGVALGQASPDRFRHDGPFEYFEVSDQIMDFRALGERLLQANDVNPERARFNLRDVVAEVPMPENPDAKVAQVARLHAVPKS